VILHKCVGPDFLSKSGSYSVAIGGDHSASLKLMNHSQWKDYFSAFILALVLSVLVRIFILAAYKIPTGSMQPTLLPGDFVFSFKLAYDFKNIQRGDIVVFQYPQNQQISHIKRIMALPGDRVQIIKNQLYINNQKAHYKSLQNQNHSNPHPESFDLLQENLLQHSHAVIVKKNQQDYNFGPIVVPPQEVFVLGDNRDVSDDSRYWGTVPMKMIQGKVVFRWLSLDVQKKWAGNRIPSVRWDRVFTKIE
jgi:signal peptidase I